MQWDVLHTKNYRVEPAHKERCLDIFGFKNIDFLWFLGANLLPAKWGALGL